MQTKSAREKIEDTLELRFEKILKATSKDKTEEGFHQKLLNIGYNAWQQSKNKDWSYGEMLRWVGKTYDSDLLKLAILLGKYNQQVCNGGHIQYFDNGYASEGGGFYSTHDTNMPLHKEMLDLMKKYGLHKSKIGAKVYQIASELEVGEEESCDTCHGSGSVDEECCECDGTGEDDEGNDCSECDGSGSTDENCDECDGNGNIEPDNSDLRDLDTRYYKVNDAWMKYLEGYFKKFITTGVNPLMKHEEK